MMRFTSGVVGSEPTINKHLWRMMPLRVLLFLVSVSTIISSSLPTANPVPSSTSQQNFLGAQPNIVTRYPSSVAACACCGQAVQEQFTLDALVPVSKSRVNVALVSEHTEPSIFTLSRISSSQPIIRLAPLLGCCEKG